MAVTIGWLPCKMLLINYMPAGGRPLPEQAECTVTGATGATGKMP